MVGSSFLTMSRRSQISLGFLSPCIVHERSFMAPGRVRPHQPLPIEREQLLPPKHGSVQTLHTFYFSSSRGTHSPGVFASYVMRLREIIAQMGLVGPLDPSLDPTPILGFSFNYDCNWAFRLMLRIEAHGLSLSYHAVHLAFVFPHNALHSDLIIVCGWIDRS